jgi:hypothetical protein
MIIRPGIKSGYSPILMVGPTPASYHIMLKDAKMG